MVVISVYTYGVKIIKKFRWESGFLWGVPWNPPLCTNGSAGYLMQLSVKIHPTKISKVGTFSLKQVLSSMPTFIS